MFYILFHFKLIEPSSNGQPCGSFTMIPCQQHVMLFLYDFCAHLSSGTQIWDYFHFISPSSRLMPLILFFACNFAKIILCKEVLHIGFTYFLFKFIFAYKNCPQTLSLTYRVLIVFLFKIQGIWDHIILARFVVQLHIHKLKSHATTIVLLWPLIVFQNILRTHYS